MRLRERVTTPGSGAMLKEKAAVGVEVVQDRKKAKGEARKKSNHLDVDSYNKHD